MARRQRASIELTTFHLTIVGALTLAASAVVFLFGIYVGRGLPSHHAGLDDQVARIPVSEAPRMLEVDRGPMPPVGPVARAQRPAEPPRKAPPPPEEPSGVIADAIAAATRSKPAPEPTAAAPRNSDSGPTGPVASPVRPEQRELPYEPPVREATPGSSVPYTVQVLATRNREEADALAKGLKGRRIGAFVSEVEDTGGNWYRVRIGIYDDLESAQVMEARLRKLGLQQAYVSRYR